MWNWITSNWAKINFGQHAKAFIRLMEIVASVVGFALPIVRSLEQVKSQWSEDASANKHLLAEIVKAEKPDEEHPNLVVGNIYSHYHIGETLFNVAVWLLRQKIPDSAPYAKLAVELAYLLTRLR